MKELGIFASKSYEFRGNHCNDFKLE